MLPPHSRPPDGVPPLRVALFTGNYNHILDGVSRTLNRIVAYLEREGVPVLVFGPTVANPPVKHAGELVPVPSVPAPGRSEYRLSLGLSRAAERRLEAFDPTIVHIATPDFLGYRALRWARRRGLPVVSTYHTHFGSYLRYYRLQWAERAMWSYGRWFYGQCDELYVPSEDMEAVLRSHGIRCRMRIFDRGVDVERFNPAHRNPGWRRERGIGDDEVVVTFVGRLVREKGLRIYAEVTRRLHEEGAAARALVVGTGPGRDDLAQMLPPHAILTGHLEGHALATAYASSDVFLFPSDTEAANNVTLEAMASGLPAVCADAAGSRHLVRHGETGFLARPHDGQDFLGYTRRLISEEPLRRALGAAGRRRAEHHSWDAVLARLLGYYAEVVARQRPATAAV